jgi:hypothetical protein
MLTTEKLPGYEQRLPFYLEAFADIYREATAMIGTPIAATEFVCVENRRRTALYEIAALLEIPDLPPPGEQLSREQWQQCIDFIRNQESEQPVCSTCKGKGMKHTYYGDGWAYERCHCNGGM